MSIAEIMKRAPVVPVLTVADAHTAAPLARSLLEGGLPVLEVTLRTEAAAKAISAIVEEVPQAVVGAGTVLTPHDLATAQGAGARFAVSPGFLPLLATDAREWGLPWLPGVATASEVMAALEAGHDCLKFFPAEASGGVAALKALYGPFPAVQFCPTGGIDADNAADYLALPNVLAVGGSWVAPADRIAAGDWDGITARARAAAALQPSRASAARR